MLNDNLLQGRYIPAFASYIHDQNAKLVSAGATPINLKSIFIGELCYGYAPVMDS